MSSWGLSDMPPRRILGNGGTSQLDCWPGDGRLWSGGV